MKVDAGLQLKPYVCMRIRCVFVDNKLKHDDSGIGSLLVGQVLNMENTLFYNNEVSASIVQSTVIRAYNCVVMYVVISRIHPLLFLLHKTT